MSEYKFSNDISETLLIPLYMRAKESRRGKDAIVHDPVAQALVEQIEYDYSKFDAAKMSEIGCAIRCRFFDDIVKNFVNSHSNPVIVNIGCGLDARCQRTVDGKKNVTFYSLDLPDTINLRRHFIPETSNETYISESMFDTCWMNGYVKNIRAVIFFSLPRVLSCTSMKLHSDNSSMTYATVSAMLKYGLTQWVLLVSKIRTNTML